MNWLPDNSLLTYGPSYGPPLHHEILSELTQQTELSALGIMSPNFAL